MSDLPETVPAEGPASMSPMRRALVTLACGAAAFAVLVVGYGGAIEPDVPAPPPDKQNETRKP